MKQKFTPTLLCSVNDVKYVIKRHKCLCDFTSLGVVFACDFTHVYYCYVIL
jgi:hypothetical protein